GPGARPRMPGLCAVTGCGRARRGADECQVLLEHFVVAVEDGPPHAVPEAHGQPMGSRILAFAALHRAGDMSLPQPLPEFLARQAEATGDLGGLKDEIPAHIALDMHDIPLS